MKKYLVDKYVVSKFLGIRTGDPMTTKFLKEMNFLMNGLYAEFILDYSTVRSRDYTKTMMAFRKLKVISEGGDEREGESEEDRDKEVYDILFDPFFFDELNKRINNYHKSLYDKYIPMMSQKAIDDLNTYIMSKNAQNQKENNEFVNRINRLASELEEQQGQIDSLLASLTQGG